MDKQKNWREKQQEDDGIIEGRNAVIEALRAGTPIDKVYIAKGTEPDAALGHIAAKARLIRYTSPKGRPTPPWATSPPKPGKRVPPWWTATGGSWTA